MNNRLPVPFPLLRTIGIGAALTMALVACGGAGAKGAGDALSAGGEPATEIQASKVMGEGPASLAEAKGQVVIVDFWATFCKPCRKSLPDYQKLADAHAGDLVVIGVSVDDPDDVDEAAIEEFANELGVRFPIVWDKEQKTADAYSPPSMPTSYLIDRTGNIRSVHEGYQSGDAEKIAAEVAKLLE